MSRQNHLTRARELASTDVATLCLWQNLEQAGLREQAHKLLQSWLVSLRFDMLADACTYGRSPSEQEESDNLRQLLALEIRAAGWALQCQNKELLERRLSDTVAPPTQEL